MRNEKRSYQEFPKHILDDHAQFHFFPLPHTGNGPSWITVEKPKLHRGRMLGHKEGGPDKWLGGSVGLGRNLAFS